MTISNDLLDELLKGCKRPEDLLSDAELMKELKVRLMERMLGADARDARMLQTRQGQALLILHRTTWTENRPITLVRIACRPGHEISASD